MLIPCVLQNTKDLTDSANHGTARMAETRHKISKTYTLFL